MSDILGIEGSDGIIATIKAELEAASPSRRQRILEAITRRSHGGSDGGATSARDPEEIKCKGIIRSG